jgi:hypothetical protein
MQPGAHPQLEINVDGVAEWSLQGRDALARVILSHRVLRICTMFLHTAHYFLGGPDDCYQRKTLRWCHQITGANLLFLEHYEDGGPWSWSFASSNRESLETTLPDVDYADEVRPIPEKSLLHDRQNHIFALETALWHLVHSFIPSPRCSSHALPLKRRWSCLDGVRGVVAAFVFTSHYPMQYFTFMQNGYRATPADTYILQLPII